MVIPPRVNCNTLALDEVIADLRLGILEPLRKSAEIVRLQLSHGLRPVQRDVEVRGAVVWLAPFAARDFVVSQIGAGGLIQSLSQPPRSG